LAERYALAEYWIHFTARFGGDHAFGNNCAISEPIWMKSEALRVHCRGLAPADFGRNFSSSDILRSREILFFLSGKRTISPIYRSPNFTKFEHNTSTGEGVKLSEHNVKNFAAWGRFSKKRKNYQKIQCLATLGRHNTAMITDHRKFTTK